MNTCPVYRPTWDDFKDFKKYIAKIESEGGHRKGVIKIIPPTAWEPSKEEFTRSPVIISNPVSQSVTFVRGCYHVMNRRMNKMPVDKFKSRATLDRFNPTSKTMRKIEKEYWLNITKLRPVYGINEGGTYFRPSLKEWNLNNLQTILDNIGEDIPGVTSPYLYFGMYGSSFGWHTEDMELYSISYLHQGAPKLWYVIPPEMGKSFENVMRTLAPTEFQNCESFLKHKSCMMSPEALRKHSVTFCKVLQKKGEIVITFPSAYHSGFNLGLNLAEAVNFASPYWIPFGEAATKCNCRPNQVFFSVEKVMPTCKVPSSDENTTLRKRVQGIASTSSPVSTAKKVLSGEIYMNEEEYLEKKFIDPQKGFGVFAKKMLAAGSFLCEYKGKMMSEEDGEKLMQKGGPSFLYFFQDGSKTYCIDGEQNGGIASYMNDDFRQPNAKAVKVTLNNAPHICIFVRKERAIYEGEEVVYDYGPDTSGLMDWRKGNLMPYTYNAKGEIFIAHQNPLPIATPSKMCVKPLKQYEEKIEKLQENYEESDELEISPPGISSHEASKLNTAEIPSSENCSRDSIASSLCSSQMSRIDNFSRIKSETIYNLQTSVKSNTLELKQLHEKIEDHKNKTIAKLTSFENSFLSALNEMHELVLDIKENKIKESKRKLKEKENVGSVRSGLCSVVSYPNPIRQVSGATFLKDHTNDRDLAEDSFTEESKSPSLSSEKNSFGDCTFPEEVIETSSPSYVLKTLVHANPKPKITIDNSENREALTLMHANDKPDINDNTENREAPTSIHGDSNPYIIIVNSENREALTSIHANHKPNIITDNTENRQEHTSLVDCKPLVLNLNSLSGDEFEVEYVNSDDMDLFNQKINIPVSPEHSNNFHPQSSNCSTPKKSPVFAGLSSCIQFESPRQLEVETEHAEISSPEKKYVKPKRPCPLCLSNKRDYSNLPRHIKSRHANNPRIKLILSLPKHEQRQEFDLLKKEGIMRRNTDILKNKGSTNDLIHERKHISSSKLKICLRCKGFFKFSTIHKHIRFCKKFLKEKGTLQEAESFPVVSLGTHCNEDFAKFVMTSLASDEIGDCIRGNTLIQKVGEVHFASKFSSKTKIKSCVGQSRQEMRVLAFLFLNFRNNLAVVFNVSKETISLEEMFQRHSRTNVNGCAVNFQVLKKTILETTKDQNNSRLRLYWTLLRTCKALMGIYTEKCLDELANELTFWKSALKRAAAFLFSSSIHESRKKRENTLRKPENIPSYQDVVKVRNYILKELQRYTSCQFDCVDFVHLRKLMLTRLTFLNGRRGGEVTRLTFEAYHEALSDSWVGNDSKKNLDENQSKLLTTYKLTYVEGKGNRRVPLLITKDCLDGLSLLANEEIRQNAGVNPTNDFIFAATGGKRFHVSGPADIKDIMDEAKVSKNITATNMRHFLSTRFANENQNEHESLEYVSLHFGHDPQINKDVYQCPLAIQEITHVGALLDSMEKEMNNDTQQNQNTKSFAEISNGKSDTENETDDQSMEATEDLPVSCNGNLREFSHSNNEKSQFPNMRSSTIIPAVPHPLTPRRHHMLSSNSEETDVQNISFESGSLSSDISSRATPKRSKATPRECLCPSSSSVTSKRRKNTHRACFTKEEEGRILRYFNNYVDDLSSEENKGRNPGKREVEGFLENNPKILQDFTPATRVKKLKTKCFNLRKSKRSKHCKSLKFVQDYVLRNSE